MKTIKIAVAGVLVLASLTVKADYTKRIHKAWPINKVKAMSVESKFGNINFINNREDSVTIDVIVEINGISENKAKDVADQIDFLFSNENGEVKAITEFNDRFKSNADFNISYTINIPIDRDLKVENKYGNVTLGNLHANGEFDIKYGNIYGKNLISPENQIIKLELKYGNATFETINRLFADLGYSKLTATDLESAELDSEYSIVRTEKVGTMIADSKYDNFNIESVKTLKVHSKFTNWSVERLYSSIEIETQYGDVSINDVDKSFSAIKVDNQYGNIKMGISPDASYQLKSDCFYCNVIYPKGEVITQIEDNNHNITKANIGKTGSNTIVNIQSRYGKVKLVK